MMNIILVMVYSKTLLLIYKKIIKNTYNNNYSLQYTTLHGKA